MPRALSRQPPCPGLGPFPPRKPGRKRSRVIARTRASPKGIPRSTDARNQNKLARFSKKSPTLPILQRYRRTVYALWTGTPDGREAVTFTCRYRGVESRRARENGVDVMIIKPREPTDLDNATESAVEGEIREFVRRDVATLRRTPEADSELVANNISTLLQRVAGSSVAEIDRLMAELHTLRDLLQAESARVQREITDYAHLSQSAMQSTKIISESLSKWKAEGAARARGG